MPDNRLPEGMGKKIVDVLKQQVEVDSVPSMEEEISNETSQTTFKFEPEMEEVREEITEKFKPDLGDVDTYASSLVIERPEDYEKNETLSFEDDSDEEQYEMPNNINVLKKLVSQLPTGVPRQTGAQIIRQTIEALGIPMKSVLQDAQKVQDVLNGSIKDCVFTVQEYKSNIKTLEKQVQSYQKQLAKLNEIVALFAYGDKK